MFLFPRKTSEVAQPLSNLYISKPNEKYTIFLPAYTIETRPKETICDNFWCWLKQLQKAKKKLAKTRWCLRVKFAADILQQICFPIRTSSA